MLLNRGDGSFQAKRDYHRSAALISVAIGDLNGDGKPDLATANRDANSVSVLLNRGDGSFRPSATTQPDAARSSVAIGDLNGDGKPDLVTANGNANTVSVLLNRGDGSFQAKLDYRTGRGPRSVAIGDLNGDGKPDLATANCARRTAVSVLLNTTGLCTVQNVTGKTLPAAKRTIARANCRVGKIRRAYSKTVKRGRVISQKPRFGAVLPRRRQGQPRRQPRTDPREEVRRSGERTGSRWLALRPGAVRASRSARSCTGRPRPDVRTNRASCHEG